MHRAFIIHGSYGHPKENWIPWLSVELKKIGYEVIVPKFPTPPNQSLDSWLTVFEKYSPLITSDSIFIGHSLGVAFILRILETLKHPLHASYLVSGFTGLLNNPIFDEINKSFVDHKFEWSKIRNACRRFSIFHSDNDPYVPLSFAEELSSHLKTPITLIHNAGHFNEKAGYVQFEELLENIRGSSR